MSFEELIARAAAPGKWEIAEYRSTLRKDPCSYCGERDLQRVRGGLDHIVPKVDGGGNAWDNLAPACRSCNIGKKRSSILGFLGASLFFDIWHQMGSDIARWRTV